MGYVVYASFAIQFYVPMDFLEAPLMDRLGFREDPGTRLSKGKRLLKTAVENIYRGLVVTVLCELLSSSTINTRLSAVPCCAQSSLVGSHWDGPYKALQNTYRTRFNFCVV